MLTVENFLKMESELQLNKCQYEEYAYWTYNRFAIFNMIDVKLSPREVQAIGEGLTVSKICRMMLGQFWESKAYIRKKLKKCDWVVINHPRRMFDGKKYDCVYTDDLVKRLDNCMVWESYYHYSHLKPVDTPNLMYLDRLEIGCFLNGYFVKLFQSSKYRKYKADFSRLAEKLCASIKEYTGAEIIPQRLAGLFLKRFIAYKYWRPRLEKMLAKVSPVGVIECDSYSNQYIQIVNEIAKEKNITTIELQHGVMGPNHVGYNYLEKGIHQFADKVFTYSEYWNTITRLPLDAKNCIATGFPHFEKTVRKYKTDTQATNTILFISQTVIGKQLSEFAVELQRLLKEAGLDYRIIYKLHPNECTGWRERLIQLSNSDIEVIDDNAKNIYELFNISNIQIGGFSTAIYEGFAFGLRTFCVKAYRSEDMDKLCEMGYATKVETPKDVVECLTSNDASKTETMNYEMFWKKDAMENMIRVMEEIKK